MRRFTAFILSLVLAGIFSSCVTQQTPSTQEQAFGEPVSTIPWNQPQSWEGGGGPLGSLASEGR